MDWGIEPWPFFLVLVSVVGLVTLVAFTPASLRIRELMLGATAAALGASFDVSLFGATIDRTALLLVSIVLGSCWPGLNPPTARRRWCPAGYSADGWPSLSA